MEEERFEEKEIDNRVEKKVPLRYQISDSLIDCFSIVYAELANLGDAF